MELKTEKFMMIMEPTLLKEIDDWRFANRVASRAEAVRRIVRIGLDRLAQEDASTDGFAGVVMIRREDAQRNNPKNSDYSIEVAAGLSARKKGFVGRSFCDLGHLVALTQSAVVDSGDVDDGAEKQVADDGAPI